MSRNVDTPCARILRRAAATAVLALAALGLVAGTASADEGDGGASAQAVPHTRISTGAMLGGGRDPRAFYVQTDNGPWVLTYNTGHPLARGRLMNFRAANAIWDDEGRIDDDPVANTNEFVSWIPTYRSLGLLAFTVSLQGGKPGYEGALSSAFLPDGSLKADWMARAAQVIEAADAQGMTVILTYFYKREDDIFTGDEAVRQATRNATDWLIAKGYRNVIIEVANEYNTAGYSQGIFKRRTDGGPAFPGVAELMAIVRGRFAGHPYRLPVGSSTTDIRIYPEVNEQADIAFVHGNPVAPVDDGLGVRALYDDPTVNGPILMNEDFNGYSPTQANLDKERLSATTVVEGGGSWGLMFQPYNQNYPFRWAVGPTTDISTKDEANYFRAILEHVKRLTDADSTAPTVAARQPEVGQMDVPTSTRVVVRFSEPIGASSITAASFRLRHNGATVPATAVRSPAGDTVTLTPAQGLEPGDTYQVQLSSAIEDTAGNNLAATSWSFTTSEIPANVAGAWRGAGGQVVIEAEGTSANLPRSGDTWQATNQPAGSVGGAMWLGPDDNSPGGTPITATAAEMRYDVVFDQPGRYQVWVRGYSPNAEGNSLHIGLDGAEPATANNLNSTVIGSWHWFQTRTSGSKAYIDVTTSGLHTLHVYGREDGFTLDRIVLSMDAAYTPAGDGPAASPRDGDDFTPPTVTSRAPAPDATGVALDANVVVGFSEPMALNTITAATFELAPTTGGADVPAVITAASTGRTFTLNPTGLLEPNTSYSVSLASTVADAVGNPLAAAVTWTFTTGDTTTPPVTPPAQPGVPAGVPAPPAVVPPTTVPAKRAAATSVRARWIPSRKRLVITLTGRAARTTVRVAGKVVRPVKGVVVLRRATPGRVVVKVAPLAAARETVSPRSWRVTLSPRGSATVRRL